MLVTIVTILTISKVKPMIDFINRSVGIRSNNDILSSAKTLAETTQRIMHMVIDTMYSLINILP